MYKAAATMDNARGRARTYHFDPNGSRADRSARVSFYCLEDDLRYALQPSLAKPDAVVELVVDRGTRQQVYDCFSRSPGARGSPYDLEHFIEMTGIELLAEGSYAVELVNAPERFFLSGIYPGSWQIDAGTLTQRPLPPSDSYSERFSREIIVPRDEYFLFRNRTLTATYTAELRSRLDVLDGWLSAVMPGSGFQLEEVQMETQVAILRLTAPIGWPPRPTPTGMTTSYFTDRLLRFRAFAAVLRNEIVEGMNTILERFGTKNDFRARLSIRGLRSAEEFDEIREALACGTVGPHVARNYW